MAELDCGEDYRYLEISTLASNWVASLRKDIVRVWLAVGERCEGRGRRGADAEGAGDQGPGRGLGGGPDVGGGGGRDKAAGGPAGGPGEGLAVGPPIRGHGIPGASEERRAGGCPAS